MRTFSTVARQPRCQPRIRRPDAGFTLIELMIGLTLGLVILIALSTLFLNTSNTNRELAKVNTIIEHGRFALQLIESDLVHAGFWGTHVPDFDNLALPEGVTPRDDVPTAIPDPCLGTWPTDPVVRQALQDQLIGIPVQAYADPTAATMASCTTMTNRRPGTHVLLVRHAETCAVDDAACELLAVSRVYVQSALCPSTPVPPILQPLTDPDPAVSGFTLQRGDCDASNPAELRRLISNVYFIRDGAVPTLARIRYDGSGHVVEDLIEGIEDFRVELGIDNRNSAGDAVSFDNPDPLLDLRLPVAWTPDPDFRTSPTNRGDGMPNVYLTCPATGCSIEQLVQTVSARLFVLARSPEATQGYLDPKTYCLGSPQTNGTCPVAARVTPAGNFKRHLFTTTVRLNNVSGRRETPP